MVKTDYPENFEKLWKLFGRFQKSGLGNRGSKTRAFAEFKKLKMSENDLRYISEIAITQAKRKLQKARSGEFEENFQHLERYLKNRRWEDDLDEGLQPEPLEEPDRRQELIAKMTDRSWAYRNDHNRH